jgi:hypothetical protein
MFSWMYVLPMIDCGCVAMVEPCVGAMAVTAELAFTCKPSRVFAFFVEVLFDELLLVPGPLVWPFVALPVSCAKTGVERATARHRAR